jgi:transposase-like protein
MVQKVREIGVENKVVLTALTRDKKGKKELIGFQIAEGETIENWRAFLVDLKSRGLKGKNLKLITVDGNPALLAALKEIFPFCKVQRCLAHKMRNVASKLKRSQKKPCMAEAKVIFTAPNRREAIKRFKAWKRRWEIEAERAVRCLEKDLFSCLRFYDFPSHLWKKIRTTNILERAIREVRRRTNPMGGVFTNERSCNRITYGVTQSLNENWEKKNGNTQNEFTQKT